MALPTYEATLGFTKRQHALKLVSLYLPSEDVAKCCAVSKEWIDVFLPILWENPLSRVKDWGGFEKLANSINPPVPYHYQYNAVLRLLPSCLRDGFRATLVKTLDFRQLPPRDSPGPINAMGDRFIPNIYKLLEVFEKLQFVILDGTFHRNMLQGERYNRRWPLFFHMTSSPTLLSMRSAYLNIEFWSNEHPLSELGPEYRQISDYGEDQRRNIVFLDLSHTIMDYNSEMLAFEHSSWNAFSNLRILKLRNCGLFDAGFVCLLNTLPERAHQLSSLDVRHNHLTDRSIAQLLLSIPQFDVDEYRVSRHLVEPPPGYRGFGVLYDNRDEAERMRADADFGIWSVGEFDRIPDTAEAFMDATKDEILTRPDSGIRLVRLYVTGNRISGAEAIRYLSRARKLRTFDCNAALRTNEAFEAAEEVVRNYSPRFETAVSVLVVLCSYKHMPNLQILGLDHSFVTSKPYQFRFSAEIDIKHPNTYSAQVRRFQYLARNDDLIGFQQVNTEAEFEDPEGVDPLSFEKWPIILPPAFEPEMNSNLEELTLYGIPEFADRTFIDSLVSFLKEASIQESHIEALRERHRGRHPRILPGLRKLTLVIKRGRIQERRIQERSITEDEDADQFSQAVAGDFSFFNEEYENNRVPEWYLPGYFHEGDGTACRHRQNYFKVVECIAGHRRQAREIYHDLVEQGEGRVKLGSPHFHWSGELIVVG